MAIEVGQIIDKYELLEEVGQGGMAVVYRGLDRSLRRQVAVKVLHRHLAGHKEARDRFEREAHAVAKLRHQNILEIFDFSGSDSDESYIVTEFIDGQTLRQFIEQNDIRYPEVGALITAQVCRALTHAHGLGILHRDVKPENIMIREDGVVKLMDFGIAQMIDLQRMTVTGQLLGSPAYMSPEHVEGNPLDFRTDVFSVGILLYQLVTSELPFRGRNPHEILKRIAECRFDPPHTLNPLVGKELEGIINRAMAREPDERYPDISEMLTALDQYLDGSGLSDHHEELSQFFSAPASYQMALERRLIDHLTRRGRALADDRRVIALELFNRVLTIDPNNEDVLQEIDRMGQKRRGLRLVALGAGLLLIGGAVYAGVGYLGGGDGNEDDTMAALPPDAGLALDAASTVAVTPAPVDAGGLARRAADAGARDAQVRVAVKPKRRNGGDIRKVVRTRPDASVAVTPPPASTIRYSLTAFPRGSEFRIGDGPWRTVNGRTAFEAASTVSTIEVRNQRCCQAQRVRILDRPGNAVDVKLGFLPATLTLECDEPGVTAQIDGQRTALGRPTAITFGAATFGKKSVEVVFIAPKATNADTRTVSVKYKDAKVVRCKL